MGRYINPFTDIGFKIVFGQEASKPLLLNFLNSLLKGAEQIVDITYSDKEQVTYNEEDRTLIYDVLCTTSTGEKIIVEMQNKKQTYFKKRSILYVSRAISHQGEGLKDWNYNIKAVYFVAFMNFHLDDMPDFRTDVVLMDTKHKRPFSYDIRMTFLQLPLFNKKKEECKTLFDRLIYIFKNMSKLDQFPWTINNPVFREWEDRSRVANLKGGLRDQYERALKHYRDAYSIYETATEEGRAEGIAQGIAQGERSKSIDIAQKLKAMNMSIEQIIEATGLTADEIAEI